MTDLDGGPRSRRAEAAFTAAAELLAADPGAVQRALAAHHRAPNGRCAACGPVGRWPCAVATIAHRAAGTAPPRPSGPDCPPPVS